MPAVAGRSGTEVLLQGAREPALAAGVRKQEGREPQRGFQRRTQTSVAGVHSTSLQQIQVQIAQEIQKHVPKVDLQCKPEVFCLSTFQEHTILWLPDHSHMRHHSHEPL